MDEQKKQKTNKILNIVVNVVVGIVLVVALLVTINNVASKKKGYTSLFGTAFMVVQTESMNADLPAEFANIEGVKKGFKPGDLLTVKILKNNEDKNNLKIGDIISFYVDAVDKATGDTVIIVNSHRIVEISEQNGQKLYKTKGDNNQERDGYWVYANDSGYADHRYEVFGIVKGNMGQIGQVLNFFNSSAGFLVCIVIPSFLVVIYFAVTLGIEIFKMKKVGAAEDKAKYEEELLAKLRAQGVQIPADMNTSAPAPAEAPAEAPAASEREEENK